MKTSLNRRGSNRDGNPKLVGGRINLDPVVMGLLWENVLDVGCSGHHLKNCKLRQPSQWAGSQPPWSVHRQRNPTAHSAQDNLGQHCGPCQASPHLHSSSWHEMHFNNTHLGHFSNMLSSGSSAHGGELDLSPPPPQYTLILKYWSDYSITEFEKCYYKIFLPTFPHH